MSVRKNNLGGEKNKVRYLYIGMIFIFLLGIYIFYYADRYNEDNNIENEFVEDIYDYTSIMKIIDIPKFDLTQQDITKFMQSYICNNNIINKKKKVVEENDVINLTTVIEVVEENWKSEEMISDYSLTSEGLEQEIKDILIGAEIGKSYSAEVEFDKDYQDKEIAGKKAIVYVSVNYIYYKYNEIDNSNVEVLTNNEFATINEMIEYSTKLGKTEYARNWFEFNYEEICDQLIGYSKFKEINEDLLMITVSEEIVNQKINALLSGLYYSEYIDEFYDMSEENFENNIFYSRERDAKLKLLIDYIAKQENISVTDGEYGEFLNMLKDTYNLYNEQIISTSEVEKKIGGYDVLRNRILFEKVRENIIEIWIENL